MHGLAIKAHYVFVYAVLGALLPFLPPYLNAHGITDVQVGIILALFGVAKLITPPLLTDLADRLHNNRLLLALGYVVAAGALTWLGFAESFWPAFTAFFLFALAFGATLPLLDGLQFIANEHGIAHHSGEAKPYQHFRIWGTIGFMLPAIGLFIPLQFTDAPYRIAVLTGAGISAVGAITSFLLPHVAGLMSETVERANRPTLDALRRLRDPQLLTFMGSLFLLFAAITALYSFYPRLLQNLDVPASLVGIYVNVGVVVELFFMLAAGLLLRRLGLRGLLMFGAGALAVRLLLVGAFPNEPVAVLTQVFHGPTILALYLIPPMYLDRKASPGFRNAMQGLYAMLCFGVARILGSVLSGLVAEISVPLAFTIAGLVATIAVIWLVAAFRDDEFDRVKTNVTKSAEIQSHGEGTE